MHTHTHLALTYDISPSSQKIIVYSTLNSIPMHTLFILPVCKRSKQRINFGRDVAFCRPNVASLRCFLFFFHLSFGYSSSCRSNPIRLHSRARFCLQTPFLHSPLFLFLYLLVQARSTRPLNDWLRIYFEDLIKKNRNTFKEGDEHQPFFFHEQNLMTKGRRESIPIIVYLPTPFVCNTIFLLVRVSLFFFSFRENETGLHDFVGLDYVARVARGASKGMNERESATLRTTAVDNNASSPPLRNLPRCFS
ncbi:hypothetical protein BKA57DRAFT_204238 [Linnemannia elongata]|nr:hypothetical protein BKA57DRAFT_204238 [Linnemannia elongata]